MCERLKKESGPRFDINEPFNRPEMQEMPVGASQHPDVMIINEQQARPIPKEAAMLHAHSHSGSFDSNLGGFFKKNREKREGGQHMPAPEGAALMRVFKPRPTHRHTKNRLF